MPPAFRGKQRSSTFSFKFANSTIVLLNGKNTNCVGVASLPVGENYSVRATNLERTLLDITVRPAYGGGATGVVDAYRNAIANVSVPKLISTLADLEYMYPYHQAVGYYLERVGCASGHLSDLKSLGLNWDFYLAHGMTETEYDPSWRLYYPKGL